MPESPETATVTISYSPLLRGDRIGEVASLRGAEILTGLKKKIEELRATELNSLSQTVDVGRGKRGHVDPKIVGKVGMILVQLRSYVRLP